MGGLLLFRVVGHLPGHAATRRYAPNQGQVSDKPRGRKPRGMPRWRSIARSMAIEPATAGECTDVRGVPTLEAGAADDPGIGHGGSRCVRGPAIAVTAAHDAARPGRRLIERCQRTHDASNNGEAHGAGSGGAIEQMELTAPPIRGGNRRRAADTNGSLRILISNEPQPGSRHEPLAS